MSDAGRKWTPRSGQQIERLYAWIATEPDGGQGVVGADIPGIGFVPLVGADSERINSFREHARMVAAQSGCQVDLVCFGQRNVLERFQG